MEIAELAKKMEDRCILRGEFTLASKKKANFYYDGKSGMLAGDLKVELARALWNRVRDLSFDAIGGQAVGSVPLSEHMALAAYYERGRSVDTFYVRDKPKEHGTMAVLFQAKTASGEAVVSRGRRVLILDDVVTTGGSLRIAIDEVQKQGAEIAAILVLVDRQDPEAQPIRDSFDFRPLFIAQPDGALIPAESPVPA